MKWHLLALAISALIIFAFWRWTYAALYPTDYAEALEKPLRPMARIIVSSIISVMILSANALLALRHRR